MFLKKHVGYFFHQMLVLAVVAAVVGIVVHSTTTVCRSQGVSLHPLACVAQQFEAIPLLDLNSTPSILTSFVVLLIVLATSATIIPKLVLKLPAAILKHFHTHIREGTMPFAKHLFLPTLCAVRDP